MCDSLETGSVKFEQILTCQSASSAKSEVVFTVSYKKYQKSSWNVKICVKKNVIPVFKSENDSVEVRQQLEYISTSKTVET